MAFKVLHSDMDLVLNAHAMDRQDAQVAVEQADTFLVEVGDEVEDAVEEPLFLVL